MKSYIHKFQDNGFGDEFWIKQGSAPPINLPASVWADSELCTGAHACDEENVCRYQGGGGGGGGCTNLR